ncbi:MAG: Na+/H+ antiporter NhaC family protein [Lewinellaceae bacterium]|nr:Na+/H+ antiporter NhaC family protein [Phaeodactylibacter sp.]MCB9041036.1 Na+/H+ antiporter NhaC family protein [Lewinellaceae bacterium]
MKNLYRLTFLFFCCVLTNSYSQTDTTARSPAPEPSVLEEYTLRADNGQLVFSSAGKEGPAAVAINGGETVLAFRGGQATIAAEADAHGELLLIRNAKKHYRLYHLSQNPDGSYRLRHIPMWLSIIPPLVAILLALIFREVIISLFIGVWAGAFIAGGMRIESFYYFILSFLEVVQRYVIEALNDSGHLAVLVFSLLIGGMVAIISRNGGMAGVVQSFSRYARSPVSAQFITWLLGVAIFFDDYANTLIVGNTMRKVTDQFRVSREKLAYIVDSTAAPVAAVAFITTWIGAELGYIDDGISGLKGFEADMTAYAIFIASLKYSYYPVLTLAFILMIVFLQRDYGPMYKAEIRARKTGEVTRRMSAAEESDLEDLDPVKGAPLKWHNAVIPVSLVILMTMFGLFDTGMANTYSELLANGIDVPTQNWGDIWRSTGQLLGADSSLFMKVGKLIGNSDSYVALLWASLSGVAAAILLTVGARIMQLAETISTMITGFKAMLPALLILTMAWSLAATTEELHTATFLTFALQDSVNPFVMPMIIFVLAAVISFSTGSSWSTMAILYPIAIPTTWAICQAQGIEPGLSLEILLNVIAVTLAASVLGDHCSPISDTTILSSLASDCNHIDHVRTQMPYALTVGGVSLAAAGLSTYLGGGWLICGILLLSSLAVLFLLVWRFGKKVD